MATTGTKHLGVTGPLSTAQPTEAERKASDALLEELKRQKIFESASDTNKRSVVLKSLQDITEEFVKQVSRAQGLSENVANAAGGKIFTFGSYRLGVFGPGSDIDTLVVAPRNVTKDDYFKYFPDLLLKMAPQDAITDLTPVPDAFVPIIKFEYSGISIDLIFSRLDRPQVPRDQNLLDDNVLRGLDDHELRSLNGTRVTDEILTLVPQQGVFRQALRAIKLWAQKRAIYANIIGFLGGVQWAMLVARICQLFPQAVSATIVDRFFRIILKWQWPQPVLLKTVTQSVAGLQHCKVWNPKIYKSDAYNLMPIITPAFPAMCATFNVSHSTMAIIQEELKRGAAITEKIMTGKASWNELFVKHTFFTQNYKYYLSVVAASTTKDEQGRWKGAVESKVRLLVQELEKHKSIAIAHPFNKGFSRVHRCQTNEEADRAKSGSVQCQVPKDFKAETVEGEQKLNGDTGVTMVYTETFYIGLQLHEGEKSLDLSWQVDEFKKLCTGWNKYNAELSALNIVHTRNVDLPDDVFTAGEVKPSKPLKRKAINGTNKKRTATDDANVAPPKRQQTAAA